MHCSVTRILVICSWLNGLVWRKSLTVFWSFLFLSKCCVVDSFRHTWQESIANPDQGRLSLISRQFYQPLCSNIWLKMRYGPFFFPLLSSYSDFLIRYFITLTLDAVSWYVPGNKKASSVSYTHATTPTISSNTHHLIYTELLHLVFLQLWTEYEPSFFRSQRKSLVCLSATRRLTSQLQVNGVTVGKHHSCLCQLWML